MAPQYTVRAQISGTRNGEDWPAPGSTIELPEDEAKDYLAAGIIATPTDESDTSKAEEPAKPTGNKAVGKGRGRGRGKAKAPETATAPAPETATAAGTTENSATPEASDDAQPQI